MIDLTEEEFFDEIKRICKVKGRNYKKFIYKPMRELVGKTPYELAAMGSQARYIGLITLYRRYDLLEKWGIGYY